MVGLRWQTHRCRQDFEERPGISLLITVQLRVAPCSITSCLTIHVQGKELTSGYALRGCINLVDLAGSKRVDKSEVKRERLKEAQYNKSLSALEDVIASLAQKNAHVPYRSSKLTQLLQDSLGGQAKILMFVHISPEADALGETMSTLKFAERVATVEPGAAKINKEHGEAKDHKDQIAVPKMELARKGVGEPIRPAMFNPDLLRLKTDVASSASLNDEEDELVYPLQAVNGGRQQH